jgi:AcrR family transcriptional regulator
MSEKINRRDQIVDAATKLFIQQGYTATSVRQIAEAVGCTEAALYYHFKDGKRALMQAVVECNLPDLMGVVESCQGTSSLYDLIQCLGHGLALVGRTKFQRMRWLVTEFRSMSPEERALFHEKFLKLHRGVAELVEPFVDSSEEAGPLAWTLICTMFGYAQLFVHLDVESVSDFNSDALIDEIARALSAGR